jgi:hypothetical protein
MQIGLQTRTNNMTMDDKSDVRAMPGKVLPLIQEDPRKNGKLPAQGDTSGEMDSAGGGRKPAPETPPIVTPVRPGIVAPAVPSGRPVTPPAIAPVIKKGPESGHCDTDPKKQTC